MARDKQRLFSPEQRRVILNRARGRCEYCQTVIYETWHAHHKIRWAEGGPTDVENGMCLCVPCHMRIGEVNKFSERSWQVEFVDAVTRHKEKSFLCEACPGAGKTYAALSAVKTMIDDANEMKLDPFFVIVCPTKQVKRQFSGLDKGPEKFHESAAHAIGLNIKTNYKKGSGRPLNYDGICLTYGQLPIFISAIEQQACWADVWLIVVFDEVHHCADDANWGNRTHRLGEFAKRIICLSGTPFRSDGRRIPFIRYDEGDKAKSDKRYSYREAIRDGVCRRITFKTIDGISRWCIKGEKPNSIRLRDVLDPDTFEPGEKKECAINRGNIEVGKAYAEQIEAIAMRETTRPASEWIDNAITDADMELQSLKNSRGVQDAAGLIVVRGGKETSESDDRYAVEIARKIKSTSGEEPELILHDDPDASSKITDFVTSKKKWIVAVNMVSEGVDIPRLRVGVYATTTRTELYFRQFIGRFVRWQDEHKDDQGAVVWLPGTQRLCSYAKRVEEEANAGLREKAETTGTDGPGTPECEKEVYGLGSTFDDPTLYYGGMRFTQGEIAWLKANAAREGVEPAKFGYMLHSNGVRIGLLDSEEYINPEEQKIKYRKRANIRAKQVAMVCGIEHKIVNSAINRCQRVKSVDEVHDNYPWEKMKEREEVFTQWLEAKEIPRRYIRKTK